MGKLFQLQTSVASGFGSLVMGMLSVWPSYTVPLYMSNATTPLNEAMTQADVSLLGSLPSLGAMFGTAVVGSLINTLGRKNGSILLALPVVISWAVIAISTSPKVVLGARFFSGISGGAALVYGPIFISEVAEDSIRGALASMPIILYCLGTLLSYLIGWGLTYRTIIWSNLLASVLTILQIVLVTESPVFLLRQKREEDASKAIAHYRGLSYTSPVVLEELSKIKQQITPAVELISVNGDSQKKTEEAEKEKLNSDNETPERGSIISPIKLLFVSPSSFRAFTVVCTVITIQVFMGMVPVQVYAKTVFTESDPENSDMFTVIFALVLLCGSLVTAAIADKAGRRILIIASSMLVAVCMASLGYLAQSKVAPPWVTVGLIMVYCFSFIFGAGSVPYVLLAEVFVPEVQSLASMIIIEWVWFLNFLIIGIFPYMTMYLGTHGVFYFFAIVSICNATTSFFIVPETKGLSKQQIQETFLKRKN